jgi:hypothetical protein
MATGKERRELLRDLQQYTYDLAKRRKGSLQIQERAPMNDKACLELPRQSGGTREAMQGRARPELGHLGQDDVHPLYWSGRMVPPDASEEEVMDYHRNQPDIHPYGREMNAEAGEAAYNVYDLQVAMATMPPTSALARGVNLGIQRGDYHIKTTPVALPERGLKSRVVSLFPAPVVVLGQRINKALIRLLRTIPCFWFDNHGIPVEDVLGVPGEAEEYTSADLSTASDLLEFDVCNAIWKGLSEAAIKNNEPGWTKELVQAGYAMFGGHEIVMPNDPDARGANAAADQLNEFKPGGICGAHARRVRESGENPRTVRGAPMGLGTTWPLLSIAQAFLAHRACKVTRGGSMKNVRICGDDLIARWESTTAEEYFISIEKLGLSINREKTIRSQTGGVFVGQYFRVLEPGAQGLPASLLQKKNRGTKLLRQLGPVLTVIKRVTLSALLLAKRDDELGKDDVNVLTILGDCIRDSARGASTRMRNRAIYVSGWFWSRAIARMRKSKLPVHLPYEFGGWGMPGKYDAPEWWRKAIANLLALPPEERPPLGDLLREERSTRFERKVAKLAKQVVERTPSVDTIFEIVPVEKGMPIPAARPRTALGWDPEWFSGSPSDGASTARAPLEEATGSETMLRVRGIPVKQAKLSIQLRLAELIRSSTTLSSATDELTKEQKKAEKERLSLASKQRRIVQIMRRLNRDGRKGINPVNLKTLRGRQGNLESRLVDLAGLSRQASDLDLDGPDIVYRAVEDSGYISRQWHLQDSGKKMLRREQTKRERSAAAHSKEGGTARDKSVLDYIRTPRGGGVDVAAFL